MAKLNKVKDRILYLSPSVQAGWEDESNIYDFEPQKNLGRGAFGKVYKATHKKTKLTYAIKEMEKKQLREANMVEQVVNEVKIMYSLNHDYIIKLYNHFEDEDHIYLVLEFAQGGQLYHNLFNQPGKRFPEKIVAKYIRQLVLALDHIHRLKIIHRDIKPENILIDHKDNVKLADFGWSNFFKPDQKRNTFCGTLDYLAPEMIESTHKHNEGVDIWSVGVLSFELLTGYAPFSPPDDSLGESYVESETKKNIKNVNLSFPKDFSTLAKDFIIKVLVKDPSGRLKIEEMANHVWLTSLTGEKGIPGVSSALKFDKPINANASGAQSIFTVEEIHSYTRPDSIIKKDFDESYKLLPNYNKKYEIKTKTGLDDDKQKNVDDLLHKIKQLEARNRELEIYAPKESDKNKAPAGTGKNDEEVNFLKNKLKLVEENYLSMKVYSEENWNKMMEKEKTIIELKNELRKNEEVVKNADKIKQKLTKLQDENTKLKDEVNALRELLASK